MKETIQELYNIDTITFIKISNKVYHIKASNGDYALKYIEQVGLTSNKQKTKK